MVLNPKKKSKRGTLKGRAIAEKKRVQEKRRVRKTAKKNAGALRFKRKDPGIPNSWPFKEDELNALAAAREQAIAAKKEAKARRRGTVVSHAATADDETHHQS